jgi:hypothetical protein
VLLVQPLMRMRKTAKNHASGRTGAGTTAGANRPKKCTKSSSTIRTANNFFLKTGFDGPTITGPFFVLFSGEVSDNLLPDRFLGIRTDYPVYHLAVREEDDIWNR